MRWIWVAAAFCGCATGTPQSDGDIELRAELADTALRMVNVGRPEAGVAHFVLRLDGTGLMRVEAANGRPGAEAQVIWRVEGGQLCVRPAPGDEVLSDLGEVCSGVAIDGSNVTIRTDRGETFAGTISTVGESGFPVD